MSNFLDYVATNATIQLSVPTFNETLPVNVVHGWIVIHQRLDATIAFNRSWVDFRNGFSSDDSFANGSFWLGNEAIYQLTAGGNCRLRIEVQANWNRSWNSVEYNQFYLGNETMRYTLYYTGPVGDIGDSFGYILVGATQNGQYFTTFDLLPPNWNLARLQCAAMYGGGFWHNNCGRCCLTCPYGTIQYYWGAFAAPSSAKILNQLMTSRMMIKCT